MMKTTKQQRCYLFFPILFYGVFNASISHAQQAADSAVETTNVQAEVKRLLAGLDANSLNERQRSERELIELGPQILKLLPRENELPTAEMRQRVRRIRSRLEKVESKISIDATPVTIRDAKSLGDALQQLSRESKIQFEGEYNTGAPIDVDVTRIPFWNALDEVLDASDMDVNPFGGVQDGLQLVPRRGGRPRRTTVAAYSGVFRIEPLNVTSRRDLHNEKLNGLDVMIDIAWEPRLTPIGLSMPLNEFGAKLDNGKELVLQESAENAEAMPTPGVPSTQATIPFQLPAGQPFSIETLSGRLDALLPGPIKTFDFALKQKTFDTQDAGEVTVTLDSVSQNGSLHELRVIVKFQKADRALESHRGWVFDNPAFIISADDADIDNPQQIENLGYEMFRQTANEVGIGYLFDLEGHPERYIFRYATPSSIVRSEVLFTLHDIALP